MVCARMIYIYAAFTQYPNRYLYPTFSESDSYRIRYSLFVSVTESIRIRICIQTLSVSESESEQKYENKYNMSDIRLYPIRFHPYLGAGGDRPREAATTLYKFCKQAVPV